MSPPDGASAPTAGAVTHAPAPLRVLLNVRGFRTLTALAEASHIALDVICRMSHGFVPNEPTTQRVAKALGVSPAVLLDSLVRSSDEEAREVAAQIGAACLTEFDAIGGAS